MGPGTDMASTIHLSLKGAVARQGSARGIWIADRSSRSLVCFDAARGDERARIAVEEAPVALSAAGGFLAAALESGVISAFDLSSGRALWRRALGSGDVLLRGAGERIWAAERGGAALLCYHRYCAALRI